MYIIDSSMSSDRRVLAGGGICRILVTIKVYSLHRNLSNKEFTVYSNHCILCYCTTYSVQFETYSVQWCLVHCATFLGIACLDCQLIPK